MLTPRVALFANSQVSLLSSVILGSGGKDWLTLTSMYTSSIVLGSLVLG